MAGLPCPGSLRSRIDTPARGIHAIEGVESSLTGSERWRAYVGAPSVSIVMASPRASLFRSRHARHDEMKQPPGTRSVAAKAVEALGIASRAGVGNRCDVLLASPADSRSRRASRARSICMCPARVSRSAERPLRRRSVRRARAPRARPLRSRTRRRAARSRRPRDPRPARSRAALRPSPRARPPRVRAIPRARRRPRPTAPRSTPAGNRR